MTYIYVYIYTHTHISSILTNTDRLYMYTHTVFDTNKISNILAYLSTCLIVAFSGFDESIVQIKKHSAYSYV